MCCTTACTAQQNRGLELAAYSRTRPTAKLRDVRLMTSHRLASALLCRRSHARLSHQEEEERFDKLLPANKADHGCSCSANDDVNALLSTYSAAQKTVLLRQTYQILTPAWQRSLSIMPAHAGTRNSQALLFSCILRLITSRIADANTCRDQ